jgi:hypothetical protein
MKENREDMCRDGRSQDLPNDYYFQLTVLAFRYKYGNTNSSRGPCTQHSATAQAGTNVRVRVFKSELLAEVSMR